MLTRMVCIDYSLVGMYTVIESHKMIYFSNHYAFFFLCLIDFVDVLCMVSISMLGVFFISVGHSAAKQRTSNTANILPLAI